MLGCPTRESLFDPDVAWLRYGMVYPGVGWVIWRTKLDLPEELVFKVAYLGEEQVRHLDLQLPQPSARQAPQLGP